MGIKTNNLFFADDWNIHSNDPEIILKIQDLSHNWETEYGMKFSAEKCHVLSKRKNLKLNIGGYQLPF